MTILICEDLARPDPVADIIRAVGPSLVISLLQDGPQLLSRWPARYASVLSDDPGCSVLTVTGLGMTQLSRALDNDKRSPSRVVALWKQDDGETREVELPQNCDAVVLCLSKKWEYQWTSDGRHDNRTTGKLVLSGVHPINVKKP